jgi:hypothetical protein
MALFGKWRAAGESHGSAFFSSNDIRSTIGTEEK